uniref:Major facilitator superfamily (MFS) profile domain-containing protein n=1 Tax=Glossina palpalis gambiensis TaxID=67801 RepID=A0A1B0BL31_9MUSC
MQIEIMEEENQVMLNDYSESDASKRIERLEYLRNEILKRCSGEIGKWQMKYCSMLALVQVVTTLHVYAFVFQTADKDFWCARPPHLHNIDVTFWRNLTQPKDVCSVLDADYSTIRNLDNLVDYVKSVGLSANYTQCLEFEFSRENGEGKTLVEEFGLVCKHRELLSVVEMCFLAGAAIGSVLSGYISDRYGRKHTLLSFAFVQTVFGTILAFSTSLAMYMGLRVIIGFASMTVAVVSFVLVVELVSGKWRTIIGILNILPVAATYVLSSGIAYYIRDWRTLQLTISLPWFVFLSMYCVPESPRWLLARGKLQQLYSVVERAARMNGITLPANYQKSLEAVAPLVSKAPSSIEDAVNERNLKTTESAIKGNPLTVVFGKTYWRTTCLTLISWLSLIIIYFGLTLHLSNFGGDIYVNTAIAGTIETISICLSIFVVLKFGIKRNLVAYMLIPGVCCLATNLVPKGEEYLIYVIALAMIAKCVIGASNAIIPIFTAMQYPTIVRNFGVGIGNLGAGVALILVPYMWLLEHIEPLLPMTIMGICGLIGSVALIMMKDIEQ